MFISGLWSFSCILSIFKRKEKLQYSNSDQGSILVMLHGWLDLVSRLTSTGWVGGRWREEDMEQRHVENARYLWTRCVYLLFIFCHFLVWVLQHLAFCSFLYADGLWYGWNQCKKGGDACINNYKVVQT